MTIGVTCVRIDSRGLCAVGDNISALLYDMAVRPMQPVPPIERSWAAKRLLRAAERLPYSPEALAEVAVSVDAERNRYNRVQG